MIQEEEEMTDEEKVVSRAGKVDAKKRLEKDVMSVMSSNIVQSLGTMLDSVLF